MHSYRHAGSSLLCAGQSSPGKEIGTDPQNSMQAESTLTNLTPTLLQLYISPSCLKSSSLKLFHFFVLYSYSQKQAQNRLAYFRATRTSFCSFQRPQMQYGGQATDLLYTKYYSELLEGVSCTISLEYKDTVMQRAQYIYQQRT